MSIRRVLLLGEFSSVHINLRDGLRELGVNARVASFGDGYKNYERDINMASNQKLPRIIRYPLLGAYMITKSPEFIKNDIVQLIYPVIFPNLRMNNFVINKFLKRNNGKIFYNVSGHDMLAFELYEKGALGELSCDAYKGILQDEKNRGKAYFNREALIKAEKKVLASVDGFIANIYDYYLPYSIAHKEKLKGVIPFPINVSKYEYNANIPGQKIKIFYGVSKGREGYKGVDIVLKALEKINDRFKNDIELDIVTNIPFNQYVKKLKECNVFIDQVNSFDTGMAGLQAMAMGKIVLTGAKKEVYTIKETNTLPYFDAPPSVDRLEEAIADVISRKNSFEEIGYKARKYIETYHDSVKVAAQYLHIWTP